MANVFHFKVKWEETDKDKIDFDVVEFDGKEALSQHYEFVINLRSSALLKNTNPLGRKATLTIQMENMHDFSVTNQQSVYNGIIIGFSSLVKIKDYYYYRVILAPKLAKLRYSKKSDVYISTGLGDILNNVFNEQGFSQEERKLSFNSSDKKYQPSSDCYNRYAFICQYEESDYNFINRLMERDGVYYYFKQTESGEQVVITDRKEDFISRQESLRFRFLSEQTSAPDPNSIHAFEKKMVSVPKQVTILNYGYEKANLGDQGVISCSAFVSADGTEDKSLFGEEVIYGENFISQENQGDGQFLATIRAQELYSHSQFCYAKSTAVPIHAGMKIKLDDTKYDEYNGEYLVVEVIHKGQQQLAGMQNQKDNLRFYENTLVLLPAKIQFRPKRITPLPKIYGIMNALVDGEQDSQYPQLDSTGRYKVRLPFLKTAKADGKGSIWIRMATPYAGNGYGMHFPLNKGVEVVLAFRNGDPDLPVIVNAVFNSENSNVVIDQNAQLGGLIITKGDNIFVMNDSEGSTSIGFSSNNCWHYFK